MAMERSRLLTAVVTGEDAGRRLGAYVRGRMGVSAHTYARIKACEGAQINGRSARADARLCCGDVVTLRLPDEAARAPVRPEALPVAFAFEDRDVLIVDKPAPLACQCSDRQREGALENRLAWRYRDETFVFRPVNRLDRGTSGLMAVARHAHAYRRLQLELHTPDFVREYLAVVEGEVSEALTIDAPIAKADGPTVRRQVDFENGRRAVTHIRPVGAGCGRTLLRVRLETGRTHQIRVHLKHIGHPICGDFLYGTELASLPGRFALHSARIAFLHPMTGERIERTSELPEALRALYEGRAEPSGPSEDFFDE